MQGKGSLMVGDIPAGRRRLDYVNSGTLIGPDLRAEIVGGGDHVLRLPDGTMLADVRLGLRLDDGMGLELNYRGYLHGAPGVSDRLLAREPLDPSEYKIRTNVWFETGSEKYYWLNHTIAFGQGRFTYGPDGKPAMAYDYFRVL
jgi:hypothetical protein